MQSPSVTARKLNPRLRAPRMKLATDLVVASKTIGTEIPYHFTTENVSKSGLLLSWGSESKVPFLVNTILEMTIDPQRSWLEEPVSCLGKVVRRVDDENEVRLGIHIVQMDNEDLTIWDTCITDLEKHAKHLVSNASAASIAGESEGIEKVKKRA